MGLYYFLDFIVTLTEGIGLFVFGQCLLKMPRFSLRVCRYIILPSGFAIVWSITWFTELGACKVPLLFLAYVILYKVCYRDSIYQVITAMELGGASLNFLPEDLAMTLGKGLYGDAMIILVDGQSILRWETYVIMLLIRVITSLVVYRVVKNFQYRIDRKDSLVLTFVFLALMAFYMFPTYEYLNLEKVSDTVLYMLSSIFSAAFFVVFLYSRNTLYLREQEQQKQITIERMNRQFSYYQQKLRDEERVRSVYHDLKNHLLVLQKKINSPETAAMVEKLQSEVAMYEDYMETGNDILDIILKEKLELARKKGIVVSVAADLSDVDYIEPLDISILFGNGLDNAIEASEKLPGEERVILVKAGRVRGFFCVLIENNCFCEGADAKSRTTKQDGFLHGFGINNMRQAADKYGGQLTTKCENGRFILKILVPDPCSFAVKSKEALS